MNWIYNHKIWITTRYDFIPWFIPILHLFFIKILFPKEYGGNIEDIDSTHQHQDFENLFFCSRWIQFELKELFYYFIIYYGYLFIVTGVWLLLFMVFNFRIMLILKIVNYAS